MHSQINKINKYWGAGVSQVSFLHSPTPHHAFHLTQGKALALPMGLHNTLQDLPPQILSSHLLILSSLLSLLQPHGCKVIQSCLTLC